VPPDFCAFTKRLATQVRAISQVEAAGEWILPGSTAPHLPAGLIKKVEEGLECFHLHLFLCQPHTHNNYRRFWRSSRALAAATAK